MERPSEQTLRDDVHTNPRHVWPLPGPPGRAPMHLFIAAKSIWKFCDHMSAVTVSYFFFLLAPPASTAKNIGMNSDMVQLKASCKGSFVRDSLVAGTTLLQDFPYLLLARRQSCSCIPRAGARSSMTTSIDTQDGKSDALFCSLTQAMPANPLLRKQQQTAKSAPFCKGANKVTANEFPVTHGHYR